MNKKKRNEQEKTHGENDVRRRVRVSSTRLWKMLKTPWPQLYTPTQMEYNPHQLNKGCQLLQMKSIELLGALQRR